MFIKICGITRLHDARIAALSGAHALGFIFARSRRKIDAGTAHRIIEKLPGSVLTVGVFMDQPFDTVKETVKTTGIDIIQLHGAEDPEAYSVLDRPIIKRISISGSDSAEEIRANMETCGRAVPLIDPGAGDGLICNWEILSGIEIPFILAGGLKAENVSRAIHTARPAGVDVASGVELAPGIKDTNRVRKFIKESSCSTQCRTGQDILEILAAGSSRRH
ncbi:phosphoribosylanthranilate isomerase [bacterium]|nr:phosphoribosylanthranilate isomerase [bacterium]